MTKRILCAAVLALMSTACASSPETRAACAAPTSGEIAIAGAERLNPDAMGSALPAQVRIYQLRDADTLRAASFEDVWLRADEVLGEVRVAEDTVTVYPGETVRRPLSISPEATHIAVVAIVREPAGRTWQAIAPLASEGDDGTCPTSRALAFRVEEYRVEVRP